MSYNIKNALADFKKEDLADGMINILKDSTRTLEKTKENGFLKLSLKMQRTSIYNAVVWLDEKNGELVKTACRCGHFQKQYFSLAAWLTFLSFIVIIKITSKLYHVKI